MFIEQIRRGAFLFASVMLFAACAEVLTEDNLGNVENGVLMTKVINTPSASIDGSLLLRLTDEAAADFAAGGKTLKDELSQNVKLTSISPIFTIRPEKEDVARRHNLHRWFRVEFDGADNATVAAKLSTFSQVEMIQYNKVVAPASDLKFSHYVPTLQEMSSSVSTSFNDPYLKDQWHYINTGSSEIANSTYVGGDIAVKDAWTLTAGDRRVVVAVLDGPVKYDHPDLEPNMWKNEAEVPGDGVDNDRNGYTDDIYGLNCIERSGKIDWNHRGESGHGTHVAGIVAAANGNGIGVCGTAGGTGNGDGVRIMSCQIFRGGISTLDASAIGFVYAADNGASIAQCSFGYEGEGATYESDLEYSKLFGAEYDAIAYFMDPENNNSEILDGNIVIAASGNDSRNMSSYPAAIRDVISVTALGPDYLPAVTYTNYGPGCNIAAPGGDFYLGNYQNYVVNKSRVLSTFIDTVSGEENASGQFDKLYAYMQGTSQACPHVSGVAALGLSYAHKLGKKFTRDEFVSMLLTSVNDLDSRLKDNVMKINGYTGVETYADLGLYRGKMGTGAVDAWKFLMAIEGTPSMTVKIQDASEKAMRYELSSYFGDSSNNLTYISVECDDATMKSLGLAEKPELKYGKLSIKPTQAGSGKFVIKAIAGGENLGGMEQIGGMEITRTISVMSRGVTSDNGGWL